MAIPSSGVSLRAAREDMSLSPSGGLESLQAYRRKLDYDQVSPIALKGDLGNTCFGLMPYTGENPLTGGTDDWVNDSRCGSRAECFGTAQKYANLYISGGATVDDHYSTGFGLQVNVTHRNSGGGNIGFLVRHFAFVPDGKSITLKYKMGKNETTTGFKPQVEIVGYNQGWGQGSASLLRYETTGSDYQEKTLGPVAPGSYQWVMVTFACFCSGRTDNIPKTVVARYGEIEMILT